VYVKIRQNKKTKLKGKEKQNKAKQINEIEIKLHK